MQPPGIATPPPPPQSYGADSIPTQSPGGFWRRFVAAFVDASILGVITFPIGFAAGLFGAFNRDELLWINIALKAVSVVAGFYYTGLFYKYRGATPGKLLMGLRVVDNDTGLYIGLGTTFLRDYVGKFIGTLIFLGGFIMVGFRSDKRGLHDLLANTRVIRIS